jgi:flagellar assembly protein FliH
MSTTATAGGEVLRGVPLATTAIRVGRTAALAATDVSPSAAAATEHDAARRGFDEGFERGRAEGLDSGHREGLRLGQAEAAEQGRSALEAAIAEAVNPLREEQTRVQALVHSIRNGADAYLAAAEDQMVALCYETVCAMAGRLVADETSVRTHLAHLLTLRQGPGLATLHVHPQDAALLDRLGLDVPEAGRVPWLGDPSVCLGGAVVVGRGGGLDARLETMLAAAKDRLLQVRAKRASTPSEGSA